MEPKPLRYLRITKAGHQLGAVMNEVSMKDDPASNRQQDQTQTVSPRNDPAIDPQAPTNPPEAQPVGPAGTDQAQSAAGEVDQKNHHQDNDNTFSPGFKPDPDRPTSGESTDADIDTDGG
jgi:hypothetical protein